MMRRKRASRICAMHEQTDRDPAAMAIDHTCTHALVTTSDFGSVWAQETDRRAIGHCGPLLP
jgi:hypothetical protein